jgi:septum formation protein
LADLILASGSPRRRELLSRIGVDFRVQPVEVAEAFGNARDPQILARRLAREKAEAARLAAAMPPILAADTVVWLDGEAFGKPRDAQRTEMLRR